MFICISKSTKRDLIDNDQPDLLKLLFPTPLCFLFLTHKHSCLEASFFPTPKLNFPQKITPVLNLTFLPFSSALSVFFFYSPLSLYPHLSYSSSVSIYPVSHICITKSYHIRLAYGKGKILFWRVQGIREKKNQSGQK